VATFTNTDHNARQWYNLMTQGSEGTPGPADPETGEPTWTYPPRDPFTTLELESGEKTVDPISAIDQTPVPDDFDDPWLINTSAPPPPPPPAETETEADTEQRRTRNA
jgi:hypothetical protein